MGRCHGICILERSVRIVAAACVHVNYILSYREAYCRDTKVCDCERR